MSHLEPYIRPGYLLWIIPASEWEGAQPGEDKLHVYRYADDTWDAHTEADQCIKRHLTKDDLILIRLEFGLFSIALRHI